MDLCVCLLSILNLIVLSFLHRTFSLCFCYGFSAQCISCLNLMQPYIVLCGIVSVFKAEVCNFY